MSYGYVLLVFVCCIWMCTIWIVYDHSLNITVKNSDRLLRSVVTSKSTKVNISDVSSSVQNNTTPADPSIAFSPLHVETVLLSQRKDVSVTCDTRGNLGPCSVIIQRPPGYDWLKDR